MESDFFTDTIGSVSATVNLVTDYGANGSDANDDTVALQAAIDAMTALPTGGKIVIPAGTFYLRGATIKSNVHIVIDPGAVIKPWSSPRSSKSLFFMGALTGTPESAVATINASVRCSDTNQMWTADISSLDILYHFKAFGCYNTDNFMISNMHVVDNMTDISAIVLNAGKYNGTFYNVPQNGLIMNCSTTNSHSGYGLIQMQNGRHIFYKNLSCNRGVTLRIETDMAVGQTSGLDDVWGRDITNVDGGDAVFLQPHTMDNGHVDIRRITSYGSFFAFHMEPGFVTPDEALAGLTPGSFAATSVIADVHAVYGTNALAAARFHRFVPCPIKNLISAGQTLDQSSYTVPSSAAVLDGASGTAPGCYSVNIMNVTAEGFRYRSKLIITDADGVTTCNAVPVTGLSLATNTLNLASTETAQLTATVTPLNATDPSVVWTSDDIAVAVVDSRGLVTANGAGTAIITAATTDGGYHDTCTVTVTGGDGGGTYILHPVADSYVYSGTRVNNNYGTSTKMEVRGTVGDFTRDAYLRFNLSSVPGASVTNAVLRLKVLSEGSTAADVHTAHLVGDDSWGETTITWNNKPAVGTALASDARPAVDSWIELDVTSQVNAERNGDGLFSVAVLSSGGSLIGYYSKEAAVGSWPELVVKTDAAPDGWSAFVTAHALSGIATNDADNDSVSDMAEYALGGNPTNAAEQGVAPSIAYHPDSNVSFSYLETTNLYPGITYHPEWTTNLVTGPWSSLWNTYSNYSSGIPGYQQVERKTYGGTNENLFFRLKVTHP
ncbi:CBM96 family carbohydrate-binding protein [Pontiella sulfatireligans]|nr:DNRLRE domain-containing protein [Pontiella sulfatireligans]